MVQPISVWEIAAIGSIPMLRIFVSFPKLASLEETWQSVLRSVMNFLQKQEIEYDIRKWTRNFASEIE